MPPTTLQLVLDLLGIAVFAVSGGLAAVRAGLDLLGVLVLAAATALGGGLLRDVLIGVDPPSALRDWRYLLAPVPAGLVAFAFHRQLGRIGPAIRVFDAAGLALFVVGGTLVALRAGLGPLPAIGLGVLTGVGGGAVRDVLVREVPVVLRRELYAVPALLGATLVVVADALGRRDALVAVVAAAVVFGVRVLAVLRDWHAPVPPGAGSGGAAAGPS